MNDLRTIRSKSVWPRAAELLVLALLAGSSGCAISMTRSDAGGREDDAGAASDGSADGSVDAAFAIDAAVLVDAAVEIDAAVDDAGPLPDVGFRRDSGPPIDAYVGPDAYVAPDAFVAPDAYVGPDAYVAPDASLPRDAGSDAEGNPGGDAGSLSCEIGLEDVVSATLRLTADDHYVVYVNGALLDDVARVWSSPQTYTIDLFRHPSRLNVIAIEAVNTGAINGRDRGLLAELTVSVDGVDQVVVSDDAWLVSPALESGWTDTYFDASAWAFATNQGMHPIGPWTAIFGTSDAQWIWTYDSNVPVSEKPGAETIYARRSLSFATDGTIVDAPSACD